MSARKRSAKAVKYSASSRSARGGEVERLAVVATVLGLRQLERRCSERSGAPSSRKARPSSASSTPRLPGARKTSSRALPAARKASSAGSRKQPRALAAAKKRAARALPASTKRRPRALPARQAALQLPPNGEGGSAKPVLLLPPGPASAPRVIDVEPEPFELKPSEPKKKRSRKPRAKR